MVSNLVINKWTYHAKIVFPLVDTHSFSKSTVLSLGYSKIHCFYPHAFSSIFMCFTPKLNAFTGPRSAVGNVSGNRCESDCRSRGREFDPGRSHTFVEIDHEIISTVILLPSAESFKKGCCQLQAKVCARSTG